MLWVLKRTVSSQCSKITNTFLFLFANKMVFRAGSHKMHVRIANWEDLQKQSDLSLHSFPICLFGREATSDRNF